MLVARAKSYLIEGRNQVFGPFAGECFVHTSGPLKTDPDLHARLMTCFPKQNDVRVIKLRTHLANEEYWDRGIILVYAFFGNVRRGFVHA